MLGIISIHAPREGCDGPRYRSHGGALRFQSTHPARGATGCAGGPENNCEISIHAPREGCDPVCETGGRQKGISIHAPREGCDYFLIHENIIVSISIHAPREGCDSTKTPGCRAKEISIHAPREGCDLERHFYFSKKTISIHAPREGCDPPPPALRKTPSNFNPRTPRGVRQQTLPKSREFAWLNLLICTRGRRLSIQKQTRLCSIKLSFMLFGCEPAGEGVSSWTSHATKSKVRLEGRSAYSQSARSSAHSDFPGNKSGDCPVRGP